jgi:hypothetical protein
VLRLLAVRGRPGSFAGRTGHSGMIKITADIPHKVDEGTVYRQVRASRQSKRVVHPDPVRQSS